MNKVFVAGIIIFGLAGCGSLPKGSVTIEADNIRLDNVADKRKKPAKYKGTRHADVYYYEDDVFDLHPIYRLDDVIGKRIGVFPEKIVITKFSFAKVHPTDSIGRSVILGGPLLDAVGVWGKDYLKCRISGNVKGIYIVASEKYEYEINNLETNLKILADLCIDRFIMDIDNKMKKDGLLP